MRKSNLIEKLAGRFLNISVHHVAQNTNLIIETLREALSKHQRIEIRDFGSFCLRYHPAYRAHNPSSGTYIQTPAKYRPHFKPGKKLRERVTQIHNDLQT